MTDSCSRRWTHFRSHEPKLPLQNILSPRKPVAAPLQALCPSVTTPQSPDHVLYNKSLTRSYTESLCWWLQALLSCLLLLTKLEIPGLNLKTEPTGEHQQTGILHATRKVVHGYPATFSRVPEYVKFLEKGLGGEEEHQQGKHYL